MSEEKLPTSGSADALKESGIRVRLPDKPGRTGVTTGNWKEYEDGTIWIQVEFGPNDKQFKMADVLEPVVESEDIIALIEAGLFGVPRDLRAIVTFEKIKGDLTNVFYSMESSNTDFYPHQFKPVLKFVASPLGRLLIADEVGLGKTIEATYIWKELQAREDARNLLVVCPSMLREKWRLDLLQKFNIRAEIVKADSLLQTLNDMPRGGRDRGFAFIVSLEAIRTPLQFEDMTIDTPAANLARFLDLNASTDESALFDLVIIDEAHYLRNPSTGSNRVARLLREASRHLLLLTATPIQIASDNLYQLVRLIDPEQYHDSTLFNEVMEANAPVIRAMRFLWQNPPDINNAEIEIKKAQASRYFRNDQVLSRVANQIHDAAEDKSKLIELVRLLESRSLLGEHMVRSRKREVLKRKVLRKAQVLSVKFAEAERNIYQSITQNICSRATGGDSATIFALTLRQRQMASSLVASLRAWKETDHMQEFLWEDGISNELSDYAVDTERDIMLPDEVDFDELEAVDGKYGELRDFLRDELKEAPNEKFVVFAYFRPTLHYLARRLAADGISNDLIIGGMGDEKEEVLKSFRKSGGPSVLLSSEVGSEGIDLQFCRFLVNYDLPWNPMRVEQRIGRLDRLGQKAERISIINLVVEDTVEDEILLRLYNRIGLFVDSIGDLEEILGDETNQLLKSLLRPDLSEIERSKIEDEANTAIENQLVQQKELEEEAVNLYSEYILKHIEKGQNQKGQSLARWFTPGELEAFVEDYFALKFPGTKMEKHRKLPSTTMLQLSNDAMVSLAMYINEHRPPTFTRLHQKGPVTCIFNPKLVRDIPTGGEFIDPTHPLIRWIKHDYDSDSRKLHPVAAISMSVADLSADIYSGDYVFLVHRWSFQGIRSENFLAYSAVKLNDADNFTLLDQSLAEELVIAASHSEQGIPNAKNVFCTPSRTVGAVLECEKFLMNNVKIKFDDYEAENALRCDQQETSARRFFERRSTELSERLEKFRSQDKQRLIPPTEGLLNKQKLLLETKLSRIDQNRRTDRSFVPLAAGIIRVV